MPRKDFGPKEGKELSLLMRAQDKEGGAISATGLEEIWLIDTAGTQQIANANTSESSHSGLPEHPPKALPFTEANSRFVGACRGQKSDAESVMRLLDNPGGTS